MLRGSSFLLEKSVKFYEPLVKYIAQTKPKIWSIDVDTYNEENIALLIELKNDIELYVDGIRLPSRWSSFSPIKKRKFWSFYRREKFELEQYYDDRLLRTYGLEMYAYLTAYSEVNAFLIKRFYLNFKILKIVF